MCWLKSCPPQATSSKSRIVVPLSQAPHQDRNKTRPTDSDIIEYVQQQAPGRQVNMKRTSRNKKLSYVLKFDKNRRDTGPADVVESPDEMEMQEHGIQLYNGMPTPYDAQKVAFILRQQAQADKKRRQKKLAVVDRYYWKATKILAACTEKALPPPGTRQTKQNLDVARNYLVEWMPTVMFKADLDKYLKQPGAGEVSKQTPCPQEYEKDVVLVEWKESWELTSITNDQSNISHLVMEWDERCQLSASLSDRTNRRHDESLTKLQRQGCWADINEPAVEQASLKMQVQTNVSFFFTPCNPDLDLTDAPMEWVIQIGKHHTGGPGPVCENLAFVCDPQSHWLGSVTIDRLQFLQNRWNGIPQTTKEHLSVIHVTDQQMFIANVAATLKLYDKRTKMSAQLLRNGGNEEEHEDTAIAAVMQMLCLPIPS